MKQKQKLTAKNQGFTLIELLVYMGLLSIFLVTLTDIFVSMLDIQAESETTSVVEQDSNYILNRLKYDVARASTINTPTALGDTSSSLSLVIGGVTYTYTQSSGNVLLTTNVGVDALNSSETTVDNLSFKKIGNVNGKPTIQIQFTVISDTQTSTGSETKTVQTTLGNR